MKIKTTKRSLVHVGNKISPILVVLFRSMVAVVFQNAFRAEMHQNDVFFKKIIFKISASKLFKTHKKLIFSKNKIEFLRNEVCTVFPNTLARN
jgi:hypothetical protein